MKAIVDQTKCGGCALCETTAPDVFEVGPEGYAIVRLDPIPPGLEADVRQAVEDCPDGAISAV